MHLHKKAYLNSQKHRKIGSMTFHQRSTKPNPSCAGTRLSGKARMTTRVSVTGHTDPLESQALFVWKKIATLVYLLWKTPFQYLLKLNIIISQSFHRNESETNYGLSSFLYCYVLFFYQSPMRLVFQLSSLTIPHPYSPHYATFRDCFPCFLTDSLLQISSVTWGFIFFSNQCGSIELSVMMRIVSIVWHGRY